MVISCPKKGYSLGVAETSLIIELKKEIWKDAVHTLVFMIKSVQVNGLHRQVCDLNPFYII